MASSSALASIHSSTVGTSASWNLLVHRKTMSHPVYLEIAGVARMHLIHHFSDSLTVSPAHHVIRTSAEDQHRRIHLLPRLAQVQPLQLLVKCRRTSVLSVRSVVPKLLPLGMLER